MIRFFEPKGEHGFLSNYHTVQVGGYCCAEVAYQAQKFFRPDDPLSMEYYNLFQYADSPQKGKEMGSLTLGYRSDKWYLSKEHKELGLLHDVIKKYKKLGVNIRPDWEEVKEDVMLAILKKKFSDPYMKQLLLSTGDKMLVENSPYDSYWGSANNGKNRLGYLLMKVRSEF